ncbi:hypothetical protein ACOMHN_040130 [Nucella lapillus]
MEANRDEEEVPEPSKHSQSINHPRPEQQTNEAAANLQQIQNGEPAYSPFAFDDYFNYRVSGMDYDQYYGGPEYYQNASDSNSDEDGQQNSSGDAYNTNSDAQAARRAFREQFDAEGAFSRFRHNSNGEEGEKVEEEKVLVDPGMFLYNKRVFITALPCLLLMLIMTGETLLLMVTIGALLIGLMTQIGGDVSKRCVVVFTLLFIPCHILVVGTVLPLLWLSAWNVVLLLVVNVFGVMTGGWAILQFQAFRMEEPAMCALSRKPTHGETESFSPSSGVLQGDTLSSFLVITVLDSVLRQTLREEDGFTVKWRQRSRHPETKLCALAHADDIAIILDTPDGAERTLHRLVSSASRVGLEINKPKTEVIHIGDSDSSGPTTFPCGRRVSECSEFKYLGVSTASPSHVVDARFDQAWSAMSALKPIFTSKVTERIKIRLFRAAIESILCYSMESIPLTPTLSRSIDSRYRRMLRLALGIFYPDRISNDELFAKTQLPPLSTTLRRRRLRLLIERGLFSVYPCVCCAVVTWVLGIVVPPPTTPCLFVCIWFVCLQLYLMPAAGSFKQTDNAEDDKGTKESTLSVLSQPVVTALVLTFALSGPLLHAVLAMAGYSPVKFWTLPSLAVFAMLVCLGLFLSTLLNLRQICDYWGWHHGKVVQGRWVSGAGVVLLCQPVLQHQGVVSHYLTSLPVAVTGFAALGLTLTLRKGKVLPLVLVAMLMLLLCLWLNHLPWTLVYYFLGAVPLKTFYGFVAANFALCVVSVYASWHSSREIFGCLLLLQSVGLSTCELGLYQAGLYSRPAFQLTGMAAAYTLHRLHLAGKLPRIMAALTSALQLTKTALGAVGYLGKEGGRGGAEAVGYLVGGGGGSWGAEAGGDISAGDVVSMLLMVGVVVWLFVYETKEEVTLWQAGKHVVALMVSLGVSSQSFLLPVGDFLLQDDLTLADLVGLWYGLGGVLVLLYALQYRLTAGLMGPLIKVAAVMGGVGVLVIVMQPQFVFTLYAVSQWSEVLSVLLTAALLATAVNVSLTKILITSALLGIAPGIHATLLVYGEIATVLHFSLVSGLCCLLLALVLIALKAEQVTDSVERVVQFGAMLVACLLMAVLSVDLINYEYIDTVWDYPVWTVMWVVTATVSIGLKTLSVRLGPHPLPLLKREDRRLPLVHIMGNVLLLLSSSSSSLSLYRVPQGPQPLPLLKREDRRMPLVPIMGNVFTVTLLLLLPSSSSSSLLSLYHMPQGPHPLPLLKREDPGVPLVPIMGNGPHPLPLLKREDPGVPLVPIMGNGPHPLPLLKREDRRVPLVPIMGNVFTLTLFLLLLLSSSSSSSSSSLSLYCVPQGPHPLPLLKREDRRLPLVPIMGNGPHPLPLLKREDRRLPLVPIMGNVFTVAAYLLAATQGPYDPLLHDLWFCAASLFLVCLQRDSLLLSSLSPSNQATPVVMAAIGTLTLSTIAQSWLWRLESLASVALGLLEVVTVALSLPVYGVLAGILWHGRVWSEKAVVFSMPLNSVLVVAATSYTAWVLCVAGLVSGLAMMVFRLPLTPKHFQPLQR